jgi:hypothetical protein
MNIQVYPENVNSVSMNIRVYPENVDNFIGLWIIYLIILQEKNFIFNIA